MAVAEQPDKTVRTETKAEEAARLERFMHKKKELEVDKYFRALVKAEGSDLHMKVGKPPCVRVKNELRLLNRPPIDDEEMTRLLTPMLDERNLKIFDDEGGADFAHTCEVGRCDLAVPRQPAATVGAHGPGGPPRE